MRSELNNAKRIVVKLGTAVLTDERKHLDPAQMGQLVAQMATLRNDRKEIVIVSSGAVGAGMGALAAHLFWTTWRAVDPPAPAVILLSVAGAVGAMLLQRYVIIFSTAFSGAWTMIIGGLAFTGDTTAARAAATGNVWILYPFTPLPAHRWLPYAWALLGFAGVAVQLGITAGKKR